jgi:hypothetical protein
MLGPDLTNEQAMTALRSFLLAVCPAPFEAVLGQGNRVPEPSTPDFAVYTPGLRRRLATNLDTFSDCRFVASIAGTVMTVTELDYGTIAVGNTVFGPNVANNTTVQSGPSGTGPWAYVVAPSQTAASGVMAAGTQALQQQTELTVQIDVHGPNSADNAQLISTLLRDEYGVGLFAQSGFDVVPLHADDPKQIPFIDGEDQYEDRYIVEAKLQINPTIQVPQQFAETITPTLVDVDDEYAVQ